MLTIAYNAICLGQLDEIYDRDDLMCELGCTEEEYEILLTNGEGTITNPKTNESTYVTFDPNLYYYTYDPTELE